MIRLTSSAYNKEVEKGTTTATMSTATTSYHDDVTANLQGTHPTSMIQSPIPSFPKPVTCTQYPVTSGPLNFGGIHRDSSNTTMTMPQDLLALNESRQPTSENVFNDSGLNVAIQTIETSHIAQQKGTGWYDSGSKENGVSKDQRWWNQQQPCQNTCLMSATSIQEYATISSASLNYEQPYFTDTKSDASKPAEFNASSTCSFNSEQENNYMLFTSSPPFLKQEQQQNLNFGNATFVTCEKQMQQNATKFGETGTVAITTPVTHSTMTQLLKDQKPQAEFASLQSPHGNVNQPQTRKRGHEELGKYEQRSSSSNFAFAFPEEMADDDSVKLTHQNSVTSEDISLPYSGHDSCDSISPFSNSSDSPTLPSSPASKRGKMSKSGKEASSKAEKQTSMDF